MGWFFFPQQVKEWKIFQWVDIYEKGNLPMGIVNGDMPVEWIFVNMKIVQKWLQEALYKHLPLIVHVTCECDEI